MSDLILNTDSYKASHFLQYPEGTEEVSSYIESRGGTFPNSVFFGLQMFLKGELSRPITAADIDEAEEVWTAHGLPFNREGWQYILNQHGGYLPLEIQAVPEGTVLPVKNALVQVRNTDPMVPWLTSYMETALLRAVWYPTTVATQSWAIKQIIKEYLQKTGADVEAEIGFKLHDFGARGASSKESAAIGGTAHLVNFLGTDTIQATVYARRFYGESMAGFSIPASEHSTITAWGKDREVDAFKNMLDQFGGKGPLLACVSDSYDIYKATAEYWGTLLKDQVEHSGSTLVVRPDSGDPTKVPVEVVEILGEKFGYTINRLGYRVLPPYVRVIQGDGVNKQSITAILENLKQKGWSAENIAFGMGGALLQGVTRDTMKFAMKASAIKVNGLWKDVYKQPVTDPGKDSKKGRLALVRDFRTWRTIPTNKLERFGQDQLRTVWKDGRLLISDSFKDIRARANLGLD